MLQPVGVYQEYLSHRERQFKFFLLGLIFDFQVEVLRSLVQRLARTSGTHLAAVATLQDTMHGQAGGIQMVFDAENEELNTCSDSSDTEVAPLRPCRVSKVACSQVPNRGGSLPIQLMPRRSGHSTTPDDMLGTEGKQLSLVQLWN